MRKLKQVSPEDIISCGFTHTHSVSNVDFFKNKASIQLTQKFEGETMLSDQSLGVYESGILFKGYISNKRDLKTILRLTGVLILV